MPVNNNNIDPISQQSIANLRREGVSIYRINQQQYSLPGLQQWLRSNPRATVPHSRRQFTNQERRNILGHNTTRNTRRRPSPTQTTRPIRRRLNFNNININNRQNNIIRPTSRSISMTNITNVSVSRNQITKVKNNAELIAKIAKLLR